MPFRLENLVVLFGLLALAIPVLLHLLQRRRHDVLDWGAMQFLPDSISTQSRRWLDELLLMAMRMAMIALIVLALATPTSTSPWLAPLGDRSTRDIVLVLDGSYSMDVRVIGETTPWKQALRRAGDQIAQSPASDRFSILVARQPPVFLREEFSAEAVESVWVKPLGNPDMPRALADAWKHLQANSKATTKEIIVITDDQRHGLADLATLAALDNLGNQWRTDTDRARNEGQAIPTLRVVKVGAELPMKLPNFSLAPLTTPRPLVKVGQKLNFQSALQLDGFATFQRPRNVKVVIEGAPTQKIALPDQVDLKQGQIPITFQHRFDKVGQHVVSLILEADDVLAADNEQHVVVEVVKELPVLLVDGDPKLSAESSSFFLQHALASKQAVPHASVTDADIARPAVIVLADVPRLDVAQVDAIDRYLAEGGGLLIVAGERVANARTFYNERLHRQGEGWLPARLGETGFAKDGVQPEPRTFQHPALELFRARADGGMNQVRFMKWTTVELGANDRALAMAAFTNGEPFLVEKAYKKGRVILCTVPLDRSWGSSFPSVWEFPVLVNELAYYLAGSRTSASILQHGAPIRIADATLEMTLRTPENDWQRLQVKSQPWVHGDTGAIGIYQVRNAQGRSWSFAVPPDLREADLDRATEDDWRRVRDRLPVVWHDDTTDSPSIGGQDAQREELWWLLLLGVLALLCMEVWMTRRMALARGR